MLFKSALITQASGSVGGLTASRNKGGLYFRGRGIPTNPNSPAQIAVRDAMSQSTNAWTNILDQAQRDAWITYALNVTVVNRLGDTVNLSGQQMYNRSNIPRIRQGVTRIDDGPVTFDLGTFTNPTISISAAAASDVVVAFTDTDEWAGDTGAFLFGLVSRDQNDSIKFFKAPFRSMGSIIGDTGGPVVSPVTLTSPFVHSLGNKVFAEFRASQADGRLSNSFIVETIVTA